MSNSRTRTVQAALVGVTVLLLAVIVTLIGGIHDFEFLPAKPLEYTMILSSGGADPDAPGWSAFTILMRVLMTIGVVVILFQIIFDKGHRRYYLALLLIFGGILVAAEFSCNRELPEAAEQPSVEEMMAQPEAGNGPLLDAPEVEASDSQYVVLAVLLSGVVVLVGGVLLRKWLRDRTQTAADGRDEILESLANAAHRIRAGEDAYTVVLFCYQEMIRILSTVGRIDATYLTPREFERRLQDIGLAGQPIAELTGLFELVRYAGRVDDGFATRALACLDAIQGVHATGEH